MPEFEEAKPVDTKTDYELNSEDFSAPAESTSQHVPSPPRPSQAKKTGGQRRSRYKSERKLSYTKPKPVTPTDSAAPAATPSERPPPKSSDSRQENRRDWKRFIL